jgi:HK97 family phage portal protein
VSFITNVAAWFRGGSALRDAPGLQLNLPGSSITRATRPVTAETALQIETVWACVNRLATTVSGIPCFVYRQEAGEKTLQRNSDLYKLLHDRPNSRMTAVDFWGAMMLSYCLRGNAYAYIARDPSANGLLADRPAIALWPLSPDQIQPDLVQNRELVYHYTVGSKTETYSAAEVLHIKGLGNGTQGLDKLGFMAAAVQEASAAMQLSQENFANGGKLSGVLTAKNKLNDAQVAQVQARFESMVSGSSQRLHVLPAELEFQALNLNHEQLELLATRRFSVEAICRWFDVPAVLVHHANVTTWGSGIEQIMRGFLTLTIAPLLRNIEQAVRSQVLTALQRAQGHTIEFEADALLRLDPQTRSAILLGEIGAGVRTRAEVRQLLNLQKLDNTEVLTVQSGIVPLSQVVSLSPQKPV